MNELKSHSDEEQDGEAEYILTVESLEENEETDLKTDNSGNLVTVPEGSLLQIQRRIKNIEEELSSTQEQNQKLQEKVEDLDHSNKITESRLNAINRRVESNEELLEQLEQSTELKHSQIEERLTVLEESGHVETAESSDNITNSSSRLERICSSFDEETIKKQCNVNVQRAAAIYKNFDSWSTRTRGGARIKSGELKKFLNAELDDSDLVWTQVHRAMKCFNENTDDSYQILETKSVGKALIKKN